MLTATLLAALLSTQQPATAAADIPTLRVGLGPCLATFNVKDADGMPVYSALISVRVRHGAMSLKRMDLELSTDSNGKAIVQGLPKKSRLLSFTVVKANKSATVEQDVKKDCDATHNVVLK
jgi:hypothetical protein